MRISISITDQKLDLSHSIYNHTMQAENNKIKRMDGCVKNNEKKMQLHLSF